jgi:hypothetical protein
MFRQLLLDLVEEWTLYFQQLVLEEEKVMEELEEREEEKIVIILVGVCEVHPFQRVVDYCLASIDPRLDLVFEFSSIHT